MIKAEIKKRLKKACHLLKAKGIIPEEIEIDPHVEVPREKEFGDYSTNLAFYLSKALKKDPKTIAQILLENLEVDDICTEKRVAGGGFLNFYLKASFLRECLFKIFIHGMEPFFPALGREKRVLVEFVSSNPTGPLHIGHGRCAAFGDALARVLEKVGFSVTREYYINDAGRQMETLGESVYLRIKELSSEEVDFPKDFYKGEYIKDIAKEILHKGITLPKERSEAVRFLARYASDRIMEGIKEDLEKFGVFFDSFKKESEFYESGLVDKTIGLLQESGYVYEKDGAKWFKTSLFEQDEDRVLVKSDGEKTYFASDIAYHRQKFLRGYDLLINVWGADHHGYVPRIMAALSALNLNKELLKIILIQFVTLLKDGKPVGMSTREATFTSLRELVDEVGKDAARFIFLTRKNDAHLEFDLDLAKKKSNENPVYYVQYAHARIESILRNALEEGFEIDWLTKRSVDRKILDLLSLEDELELMKASSRFFEVVEDVAKHLEPHRITYYLIELAQKFHGYYNATRILTEAKEISQARLVLVFVIKEIIKEGLGMLGVEAPLKM
ncbi:MAG: arginine--tRNA ligase [Desulfobacterota bacterium]|nr:arginine--tRNA ligase [Thermodesulfobacteriota bacterium]MDW8001791.1 arginine--tRNA ligase [Deltaproteobacteria bacterium]